METPGQKESWTFAEELTDLVRRHQGGLGLGAVKRGLRVAVEVLGRLVVLEETTANGLRATVYAAMQPRSLTADEFVPRADGLAGWDFELANPPGDAAKQTGRLGVVGRLHLEQEFRDARALLEHAQMLARAPLVGGFRRIEIEWLTPQRVRLK